MYTILIYYLKILILLLISEKFKYNGASPQHQARELISILSWVIFDDYKKNKLNYSIYAKA